MSDKKLETGIHELIDTLKNALQVRAVGLSGGERPLPEPGEGDVDLFVYCTEIPTSSQRAALFLPLNEKLQPLTVGCLEDGHWGQGDRCFIAGVETWLLYFTLAGACAELEDTLAGKHLERLDNYYYPIGRCAMWQTMRALYDPDGLLQAFKTRLKIYPGELAKAMVEHHLAALDDVEDLERAVQRKDVFFYHFAFDLALDHFLQTLFALNKTYFPSRKRSGEYIQRFEFKPVDCERRLQRAIALGGDADRLEEAYAVWQTLVRDLKQFE